MLIPDGMHYGPNPAKPLELTQPGGVKVGVI
jgi:hypothetical protein